jgi:hypothetical protein
VVFKLGETHHRDGIWLDAQVQNPKIDIVLFSIALHEPLDAEPLRNLKTHRVELG